MFIKHYPNHKFLLAVPFTTVIARQIVLDGITKFDQEQVFRIGNDIILGYSFIKQINNNYSLKYHVFYNKDLHHVAVQNKLKDILILQEEAKTDPEKFKVQKDYKKYLNFIKTADKTSYEVTINIDKIIKELKNKGWMIIAGNNLDLGYKDVINIYRSKDCVEKAFYRFKNMLDLRRLRTHSDINSLNKIFIAFIAQIILSYIHKIMAKNNLYTSYTITETINRLKKIKIMSYGENKVLSPVSKENKRILGLFGIEID
jgi:transposase